MSSIVTDRVTARIDDQVVVFLIGMRINRLWKVHKWWPVAAAMPRMLRELAGDPDSGFLGVEAWFGNPTIALQYWRSFEHLERYAKDSARLHRPAWAAFNRAVAGNGDVGIWHETYRVRAGEYEAIYGNMPRVGLAAVGDHRPIGTASATAARRIRLRPDDVAPVDGY